MDLFGLALALVVEVALAVFLVVLFALFAFLGLYRKKKFQVKNDAIFLFYFFIFYFIFYPLRLTRFSWLERLLFELLLLALLVGVVVVVVVSLE